MSDAEDPDESPIELTTAFVNCWRCDLQVDETLPFCPHCKAKLGDPASTPGGVAFETTALAPLKTLLWSFGVMLVALMVFAYSVELAFDDGEPIVGETRTRFLRYLVAFDLFNAMVVLFTLKLGLQNVQRLPNMGAKPLLTWIIFPLLLAGLLAINFTYHGLLRNFLQASKIEDELTAEFTWLVFFFYCVQPAVFEELYCREFALRVLRGFLSRHSAILVTSVMFGLLHISAPLSIPYLILVGLYLGYARVLSDGIMLPMILHFAHNLIVMCWD